MVWIDLDGTSKLASMRNKRADNAGFGAPIFLVLCWRFGRRVRGHFSG